MGLHGPGWLYVLGMPPGDYLAIFCDFEPPEHVLRTSARAHTCAVVFGRARCVPLSREHEKKPTAGRERDADVKKKHVYMLI